MPVARIAALRFDPPSARVAALRFGPPPSAQMLVARVSAVRALRSVSPSAASASSASSASSVSSASSSASSVSFISSSAPSAPSAAPVTRQFSCYVPAEIRAFRRAARASEISNSRSDSTIFEHVIGLIKQMKVCTNMKFTDLRIKLSEHFRHMTKIMRQI